MRSLNAEYRGIKKATDVLSFPQYGAEELRRRKKSLKTSGLQDAGASELNLGDIVICIPKALQQARRFGVGFYDELLRLLIHGLLHLAGYDHEINGYRKRKMEGKERELLNAVKRVD